MFLQLRSACPAGEEKVMKSGEFVNALFTPESKRKKELFFRKNTEEKRRIDEAHILSED